MVSLLAGPAPAVNVAAATADSVNAAPVRVLVAAIAAVPAAWVRVPVAAVAPPKLRLEEDNKPVETPMVLLPDVLPSLRKTFRVLVVKTCPPLKFVVDPMLSISALMD